MAAKKSSSTAKKSSQSTSKRSQTSSSSAKTTKSKTTSSKKKSGTQTSAKKKTNGSHQAAPRTRRELKAQTRVEIWDLVLIFLAALFDICLFLHEKTGTFGSLIYQWMIGLFGLSGYLMGIFLLVILIWRTGHRLAPVVKWICAFLAILLLSVILYLVNGDLTQSDFSTLLQTATVMNGGALGGYAAVFLSRMIGRIGGLFVCCCLMLILLIVITERSLLNFINRLSDQAAAGAQSKSEQMIRHHEENQRLREEQQQAREEMLRQRQSEEDLRRQNSHRTSDRDLVIADPISSDSKESVVFDEETLDIPFLENDFYLRKKRMVQKSQETENEVRPEMPEGEKIKPASSRRKTRKTENQEDGTKKEDPKDPEMPVSEESPDTFQPEMDMHFSDQGNLNEDPEDFFESEEIFEKETKPETPEKKSVEIEKTSSSGPVPIENDAGQSQEPVGYIPPSLDLLQKPSGLESGDSREELKRNAKVLVDALKSFGVDAKVLDVNKGPAVTRYELQPSEGVRVSRIMNLSDDIALHLATSGIRIEQIAGKKALGIEVPNAETTSVYLREVIDSDAFRRMKSPLTVALGKDIDGQVRVTDLSKMPHLLIAGSTGSGKSVCINCLLVSLIYKSSPDEVGMILIDPKVVELSVYNGIPHLLTPVVTDPNKAALSLNWAVQEMTRRYKAFSDQQVRDIRGYNEKVEMQPELGLAKMKRIVIVIDELADLMMVAAKEVEDHICRLAQMARAAGLHLVIATQRPSVDVITGLIKANIPSRLAFAVSSGVDSRTILDMTGAEKLLGKGDMLFAPIGASKPIRIQGAFVSDHEVEAVTASIRREAVQDGEPTLAASLDGAGSGQESGGNDEDELLEEAIQYVVEKQKASISLLQRVFRIGFNRAARLMDALEERGIVGPEENSKPRKVLLTIDDMRAMNETDESKN